MRGADKGQAMGLNRRKLKDWALRHMLRVPPANAFAVYHVGRHAPSLVTAITADEGTTDDRAETIERITVEEVTDHVEAWPGRQQYFVKATGENNDDLGEFAFAMSSRGNSASSDLTVYPPENDPHGSSEFQSPHAMVTLQQMRHNEGLVRWIVELSRSASERDAQIMAAQQRQIDLMEDRRMDVVGMLEGMYSQRQERDLKQSKQDKDEARKDKLLRLVTNFVIPEMARRSGFTPPGDVAEEIKQIFMRLPEDTHTLILEQLPKPDRDKLLDLFEGKAGDEEEATKH
jgi:hypothetical protein